ncbi:hypothetical protein VTK26DRAFT_1210 [Humicola hyalothermophila]
MSASQSSSSTSLFGGRTFPQFLAEVKANAKKAAEAKPEKPKTFRDGVVQDRVYRERDRFIASIRDEDVCQLASKYHNRDSCVIFKPSVRGSFNICYFVEFPNGDKWVVRVPLAPTLGFDPARKLESEVAAMRLVATRTSIPVPKVHAYALGTGPAPFSSFVILEYIQGRKLDYAGLNGLAPEQRRRLYRSLADMYVQLRRLEFPAMGCLVEDQHGARVGRRAVTLDTNMQELEGMAPFEIMDSYYGENDAPLRSADRYAKMLLDLADNAFRKSRTVAESEEQAADRIYHFHMFRQHAETWVDRRLDQGPFVLVHGDLEIFNLLLDHDMNIVGVLDWEWSRAVPLQLFISPLWLNSTTFESLCYSFRYRDYLERFDEFLAILRAREREKYGNELLADEWDKRKKQSGFLVAYALERWTAMDWFANLYLNFTAHGGRKDLPKRVEAFIQSDPACQALAKKKALDWASYKAELETLNKSADSRSDQQEAPASSRHKQQSASSSGKQGFQWPYNTLFLSPVRIQLSPYTVGATFLLLAVASSYMIGKRAL